MRTLALIAVGALALAACADDSGDATTTAATTAESTAASTSAPPTSSGPATSAGPSTSALSADLVEVEPGRRVDFPCTGSGPNTVILISGLGTPSSVWSAVEEGLALDPTLTVCRFERAGLGVSDPPPEPVDATDALADLTAALDALGYTGPVTLVGASYGGLVSQLFARTTPERVAGMVLVDSTHPDLDARIEQILPAAYAEERRVELGQTHENAIYDGVLASDAAVKAAGPFPPVPLVVLRHGKPFESEHDDYPTDAVEALWLELQQDLAALSPCSSLRLAPESGHRINQDQPELVEQALLDVQAAIAGNCATPLP